MPTAGIRVLVVGRKFDLPYEVTHAPKVANLLGLVAQVQPDIIITSEFQPGALTLASFQIRKKWLHVPVDAPVDAIINAIENCYAFNIYHEHPNEKANALISVYTGTYNTGDYLRECYESIRTQTYPNWEWVVVDDMSEDKTWDRLVEIAQEDIRVRPFRSGKRLRKVGAVKDMATRLCRGEYLVELDHDDMLTDICLEEVKKAFESDPEIGFVYSNCSSFFENGTFQQFPDPFWKNRYRWTMYHGKRWLETVSPNIYDKFGNEFNQCFAFFLTVGPNHVRAFRASAFRELGGYNAQLNLADDWDLMARMYLSGPAEKIDSEIMRKTQKA
jgi:cellulose synthase/poly-beta-1,6-N-acetylglucosamine synthase-like glycosyltransferase